MTDPTAPKPIFKSRTALLGLLTAATGACAMADDTVQQWLAANAAWILMAIGAANVVLRRLTHGRVVLVPEPEEIDFFGH